MEKKEAFIRRLRRVLPGGLHHPGGAFAAKPCS